MLGRIMEHDQVNMTGRATIFVAHSTYDLADARLVRNLFEDRDYDVLLLRLSQSMTDDFLGTLLQREIQARDWLVVVSSENVQRSSWVEFEETYARECANNCFPDVEFVSNFP